MCLHSGVGADAAPNRCFPSFSWVATGRCLLQHACPHVSLSLQACLHSAVVADGSVCIAAATGNENYRAFVVLMRSRMHSICCVTACSSSSSSFFLLRSLLCWTDKLHPRPRSEGLSLFRHIASACRSVGRDIVPQEQLAPRSELLLAHRAWADRYVALGVACKFWAVSRGSLPAGARNRHQHRPEVSGDVPLIWTASSPI